MVGRSQTVKISSSESPLWGGWRYKTFCTPPLHLFHISMIVCRGVTMTDRQTGRLVKQEVDKSPTRPSDRWLALALAWVLIPKVPMNAYNGAPPAALILFLQPRCLLRNKQRKNSLLSSKQMLINLLLRIVGTNMLFPPRALCEPASSNQSNFDERERQTGRRRSFTLDKPLPRMLQ